MKKEVFLSAIMLVVTLTVTADEYIDPQTNVVYTYEPGKNTASVKAGYEEVIDMCPNCELDIVYYPGSPDAAGDVVILDRFTVGTEEYMVTSIGYAAFRQNRNIKSVIIPETVTDIGGWAFYACESLTSVQLPSGLTQIAISLFYECSQLVSVNIPSSVRTIGNNAFNNCRSLTNLTLPASLTFVGRGAFRATPWYAALYDEAPDGPFYIGTQLFGYKGDKPTGELEIKEGTTCVGVEAFRDCDGLTSITFPKSVAYVDYMAFYNCTGLKAIHITDLAAWCGIEFQEEFRSSSNPLNYAHHLYLNGEEVTDLVIPEGVTIIGDYTFDNCTALTSITIPDGVTSIGTCAFRSCENLTSVTIPPSLATIGGGAFIWCFNLGAVYISDLAAWCGITFIENAVNPLCYGAHLYLNGEEVIDLVIPEGVTNINNYVFQNYSHLTSVTIPDGVTTIGENAFNGCSGLINVTIPVSVSSIGYSTFANCSSLTNITIPDGVTSIGEVAFWNCSGLTSITIGNNVNSIGQWAFGRCEKLKDVYCYAESVPESINTTFFNETNIEEATLHVPAASVSAYQAVEPWKNFKEIVALTAQDNYRPFIEDGKVWKVGTISGNPVQVVDYYYFVGDTIIDGKTCKQMMCQRYVSPDFSDEYWTPTPSLSKVGVWYEEDKKVYCYDETTQSMTLRYDFSLAANDTLKFLTHWSSPFIIGPKQTGGIEGFKGVYRDIRMLGDEGQSYHDTFWLEGVGCLRGPISNPCNPILAEPKPEFLMSCSVGDEVIYLNDEVEDGATPDAAEARKNRFDFTHTIKTQPKAPSRRSDDISLYGEYSNRQLDINLDPLADAYQVRITDESGEVVYEKSINAGTIVGLSIDISAYAKGRYTVTVENSRESFTGEFNAQETGIYAITNKKGEIRHDIYNLHGQRLSSLQKGLNIVNGQKLFVK